MSIYANNENGAQVQFASNKGWGDVCREAKTPALKSLCDHGITEDIAGLKKELPTYAGEVGQTLSNLLGFMNKEVGDVLIISDGTGPE